MRQAVSVALLLATADIGSVVDISDLNVLGKHSVSDNLEVGAKFGTQGMMALTGAVLLLPTRDADDPGISVGVMRTMEMESGLSVNNWLQATLLKGCHADGIGLNLLIEPTKALGDNLTGGWLYDLLVGTSTDSIGDNLGINLGPNVDVTLNGKSVINAGITIGIAGDAKQDDVGLVVTLVATP